MRNSFHLKFETISGKYDTIDSSLKITVQGDLKSTTVDALQRDFAAMLASSNVRLADLNVLELDLKSAALIDSLGLNLLVSVLRRMKMREVPLRVRVSLRSVYRTLLSVGLNRQLEVIFEDSAQDSSISRQNEQPTARISQGRQIIAESLAGQSRTAPSGARASSLR